MTNSKNARQECQTGTPDRNARQECQTGMPDRNARQKRQTETPQLVPALYKDCQRTLDRNFTTCSCLVQRLPKHATQELTDRFLLGTKTVKKHTIEIL